MDPPIRSGKENGFANDLSLMTLYYIAHPHIRGYSILDQPVYPLREFIRPPIIKLFDTHSL
jgi:hypothetical protein